VSEVFLTRCNYCEDDSGIAKDVKENTLKGDIAEEGGIGVTKQGGFVEGL